MRAPARLAGHPAGPHGAGTAWRLSSRRCDAELLAADSRCLKIDYFKRHQRITNALAPGKARCTPLSARLPRRWVLSAF